MRSTILIAILMSLPVSGFCFADEGGPPTTRPAAASSGDEARALQEQITQAVNRIDTVSIGAAAKKLKEEQEQLRLEAAGAEGRKHGLENAIKEYTEMIQVRADEDPVVKELEKIPAYREQELKRMQQLLKINAVSPNEVNSAEAALASARADLAAAKQRAAGARSIEALDDWNRELMNLSIDSTERRARLDYINARLQKVNKVDEDWTDLNEISGELSGPLFGANQSRPSIKPEHVKELINRLKSDYADLESGTTP